MSTAPNRCRPERDEFAPFYTNYVDLVTEENVLEAMESQAVELVGRWRKIDGKTTLQLHPPYTWSLRQVVGHLCDAERVFGYRALRFARNDQTELPGFDEVHYVEAAGFNDTPWNDLIDEFAALRKANTLLFKHLQEAAWLRTGSANGSSVSVRALAYILVGHARHHARIIDKRVAGVRQHATEKKIKKPAEILAPKDVGRS